MFFKTNPRFRFDHFISETSFVHRFALVEEGVDKKLKDEPYLLGV